MTPTSPYFVKTVRVEPYPDGRTWYLLRELVYVDGDLRIVVPKGFETDFASVPTVFTNVFPRWGVYGEAAVLHDWLYWNQQFDRERSDDVFLEAMVGLGVSWLTRMSLYYAVRIFGQCAWDDNHLIASQGFSRVRTKQSPAVPKWSRGRDQN